MKKKARHNFFGFFIYLFIDRAPVSVCFLFIYFDLFIYLRSKSTREESTPPPNDKKRKEKKKTEEEELLL